MYYLNADGSVEEVKPTTSCDCNMCRKKRKLRTCNKWFTIKNIVLLIVIITGIIFLSSNYFEQWYSKFSTKNKIYTPSQPQSSLPALPPPSSTDIVTNADFDFPLL